MGSVTMGRHFPPPLLLLHVADQNIPHRSRRDHVKTNRATNKIWIFLPNLPCSPTYNQAAASWSWSFDFSQDRSFITTSLIFNIYCIAGGCIN